MAIAIEGKPADVRARPHRAYRMLVGGRWVASSTGATFDSIDPYARKAWSSVPAASPEDADHMARFARCTPSDLPIERRLHIIRDGKERNLTVTARTAHPTDVDTSRPADAGDDHDPHEG